VGGLSSCSCPFWKTRCCLQPCAGARSCQPSWLLWLYRYVLEIEVWYWYKIANYNSDDDDEMKRKKNPRRIRGRGWLEFVSWEKSVAVEV
jgi:hypothetical protein